MNPDTGAPAQPPGVPEGWRARRAAGLLGEVGPLWARREGDAWAYGLLADRRHVNGAGVVHGGMLVTLADQALSLIAWEALGRRPCLTVQLDSQFLGTVRPGEFIEARGTIVHRGGTLLALRGTLTVGARVVVTVQGLWRIPGQSNETNGDGSIR